jgi:tRNA-2-methylthio-N6-dimethylallyladenosine synthase
MNRKHTVKEYLEIVKKLIKIKPEIKFSSDFIIGYPGETYADFKRTVALMTKIGFINSFSFIFSARPGTPAFKLDKINEKDAKDRLIEFQRVAEDIKTNYRTNLINKTVSVLFENRMKSGKRYFGRDEHFNSVIVESNNDLTGKLKNVKILKGNQNTLFGEIPSNINQTNCAA